MLPPPLVTDYGIQSAATWRARARPRRIPNTARGGEYRILKSSFCRRCTRQAFHKPGVQWLSYSITCPTFAAERWSYLLVNTRRLPGIIMFSIIKLKRSSAVVLSILSLLAASQYCDDVQQSRNILLRRSRGQERTITLVTDTLRKDPMMIESGAIVYPAHSWVVFGATTEERPLRVELVSPIIGDVPHGLAVSVIELVSEREDIGDLGYPLPDKTIRTNVHERLTTTLRNAQLFDPHMPSDSIGPILDYIFHARHQADSEQLLGPSLHTSCSHYFAESLVRLCIASDTEELIGPLAGLIPWLGRPNVVARWKAEEWAKYKRAFSLTGQSLASSTIRNGLYRGFAHPGRPTGPSALGVRLKNIPIDHIFFEARLPQPRLRGAPRRPSVAALYELYPDVENGETVYRAGSITSPMAGLLQALPQSRFRHGQSIVRLSRDPYLTSGYLTADAIGSLPLLLTRLPSAPSPTPTASSAPTSTSPTLINPAGVPTPTHGDDPPTPPMQRSGWRSWFCRFRSSTSLPRRSPQTPSWCSTS